MAFFNFESPALNSKTWEKVGVDTSNTMTIKGTVNKLGFLLVMMLIAASYVWNAFFGGVNVVPYAIGGMIGSLIVSIILIFKKEWAPYLTPAYALLQGLLIGGLSAMISYSFKKVSPGLVTQATGLTVCVALVMFALYRFRIIRVTEKFKSIMLTILLAVMVYSIAVLILSLFNVNLSFLYDSSPLAIGISIVMLVIASLTLLLHFDMVEQGEQYGAPKYMEWYCAFGILMTLVWIYLRMLQLLMQFASRRD